MAGENDAVTWPAFHWLFGVFSGIVAAGFALLLRMIGTKANKEMLQDIQENMVRKDQFKQHTEEDLRIATNLSGQIHEVDQRASEAIQKSEDRLVGRMNRMEGTIMEELRKKT